MFYYRYNQNSAIILKSLNPIEDTIDTIDITDETISSVAHTNENFDLSLYDVIVGFVSPSGEILKYQKNLKSTEIVAQRILSIEESQVSSEIDIDFRLSIIELGFI